MAGEASLMGGLDPEALKGLLASLQPLTQALGPSPEDKEAAKYRAIAQAGLAMMGGRRGQEFDTIGRAGLLGLQGYNQDLQQIGQQRQQGMGLLSALMPMLQKSNLPGAVWGEGGQQPAPAPAQGAVGGSGMGGGTPALFGASSQPGPVAAPSANVTALSLGKQLVNLGYSPQLINGVLSTSKEPMKDLLDLYKEGVKIHTGAGNIPMQRNPQTGQIDAMPAAGYNEALAAQTRAQTGAQEEAKQPYTLQNLNLPGGGTQQVYGDQLQRILRGSAGAPASAGMAGNFGQSLSPAQEAEQRKRGEGLGAVPEEIASAADNAVTQTGRINEMRKLADLMPFGATAPSRVNAGRYLLDIPGVGSKLADTLVPNSAVAIPAAQAFGKMANQMVIEQSKQLGTREAASVIQMVANSNPNMSWTRAAAQTAMDYIEGSNKWAGERQQASQQWLATHNGSSDGFQAAWNKQHPLTSYIPPLDRLESAFKTGAVPDQSQQQGAQGGASEAKGQPIGTDKQTGKPLYRRADGKLYFAP
jgi:hypothetical protein